MKKIIYLLFIFFYPIFCNAHDLYCLTLSGHFDGSINSGSGQWSNVHIKNTGIIYKDIEVAHFTRSECYTPTYCVIYRGNLAFNLSQIPADAVIKSAKIGLFIKGVKDDYQDTVLSTFAVVQGVGETMEPGDYDDFGAVTYPVEFSRRYRGTELLVGQYLEIDLNEQGLAQVQPGGWTSFGFRTGYDMDNVAPAPSGGTDPWGGFRFDIWYRESGDATAPYLKIEYEAEDEEPEGLNPVIVVPGIMGSWAVDGEWRLDPILGTYDALYQTLDEIGYTPGETLFALPYQWRQDNIITAMALENKIAEAKAASGRERVDVVAHSMGGLVARAYIEGDSYNNDIGKLIFLGTPQRGSPESYLAWEGAAGWEGLAGKIGQAYFKLESSVMGYPTMLSYIRDNIISLGQLLPDYAYLGEADGVGLRAYDPIMYPGNYPYNRFLGALNSVDGLARFQAANIEPYNLAGVWDGETLGTLRVGALRATPLQPAEPFFAWEHGEPVGYHYGPGDGTVPRMSSALFDIIDVPGAKHRELPSAAIAQVLDILGAEASAVPPLAASVGRVLMASVYSPVDIKITGPDELWVGRDLPETGSAMAIVRSYYTGASAAAEFATIGDPADGEYAVLAYGTGQGFYRLVFNLFHEEGCPDRDAAVPGWTEAGESESALVRIWTGTDGCQQLAADKKMDIMSALSDVDGLCRDGSIEKQAACNYLEARFRQMGEKSGQYAAAQDKASQDNISANIRLDISHIRDMLAIYLAKNWLNSQAAEVLNADLDSLASSY